MLDSLVRVSRRVAQNHFTSIKKTVDTTLRRSERPPPLLSQIGRTAHPADYGRYPAQRIKPRSNDLDPDRHRKTPL